MRHSLRPGDPCCHFLPAVSPSLATLPLATSPPHTTRVIPPPPHLWSHHLPPGHITSGLTACLPPSLVAFVTPAVYPPVGLFKAPSPFSAPEWVSGLDVSEDASFFPSSCGSLSDKSREGTKLSLPTWGPRTLTADHQGFSAACGADSCMNWTKKMLPGILVLSALEQRWGEGSTWFAQNLVPITANEAT